MFLEINGKNINMDNVTDFYWTERLKCIPSHPSIIFNLVNDSQCIVKASEIEYTYFKDQLKKGESK